ncbi:hypothetical protein W97_02578 [Coniosporium apollinis CBS 100218]|uniref:Uncharacterized protein n=1 Tax=Coniosporium apollinis (strain CBS 100218) TaxID=1168221 RepID=R7YNV7_CONA1|nr:uncharacterized protein W97_02578 [Coniosporium apollinis CBS 100218]EON63351.1 hypothetical protein W97_02578 [Coniosporium apollinis CBS 100218]
MAFQQDVRFDATAASAHRRYQSDPTAAPPTRTNLTTSEVIDLWEHASLLFATYEWTGAEILFRRIIRRTDESTLPNRACLWSSLGLVYYHSGEDWRAYEVFRKAVMMEPRNPIFLFLAGTAAFEVRDYGSAYAHFTAVDKALRRLQVESFCCQPLGLDFLLTSSRNFHNQRSAWFRYVNVQIGAPIPGEEYAWGTTQRLPAGLIFQPRPIQDVRYDVPAGEPRTSFEPWNSPQIVR